MLELLLAIISNKRIVALALTRLFTSDRIYLCKQIGVRTKDITKAHAIANKDRA